jgi:hypothetical protein
MPNGMRWVGLDVHARASTLAVFDDGTGEVITRRVAGRPIEVRCFPLNVRFRGRDHAMSAGGHEGGGLFWLRW